MTQSQEMCPLAQADPVCQTFKGTRQKALGALTPQQWHTAFQDIYNPPQPEATPIQRAPESRPRTGEAGNGAPKGITNLHTDSAITPAEVVAALDKLKRHKAAGIDGILPDFLKDGKSCSSPFVACSTRYLKRASLTSCLWPSSTQYTRKGTPMIWLIIGGLHLACASLSFWP